MKDYLLGRELDALKGFLMVTTMNSPWRGANHPRDSALMIIKVCCISYTTNQDGTAFITFLLEERFFVPHSEKKGYKYAK